jgi:hypothetical protein
MKRKNIFQFIILVLFSAMVFTSCTSNKPENLNVENARLKVLIVNGQMNGSHDDKESSPIMERMLELTGEFNVEVATSPKKGSDMSTFKPQFSDYDAILLDYDGDEWSTETKANFVNYMKAVVVWLSFTLQTTHFQTGLNSTK